MTSLFTGTSNFTQPGVDPDLPYHLPLASIFTDLGLPKTLSLLILCTWFISLALGSRKLPNAPVIGYRSIYEPTWFLQARFFTHTRAIVNEAYKKVKGRKPFILRRWDVDYLVLPIRYLNEIRRIPLSKLHLVGVLSSNLALPQNSMGFMAWSTLHIECLKRKLIPELYKYIDMAGDEVRNGWKDDVPHTSDWHEVHIETMIRAIVSRSSSRVFVGRPTCVSPEWIQDQVTWTVEFYNNAIWVKKFPPWLADIVPWLNSHKYRSLSALRRSSRIITKLSSKHEDAQQKRAHGEDIEEEDTLLKWMLDHAQPEEKDLWQMTARLGFLMFVSLFTTTFTSSHMIYDLCEHPEWFDVMREEIDTIAKDLGPPGQNPNVSAREWCNRLEKLDSFMVESQRMNAILVVSPQRIGREDIVLKDGLRIPANTRFTFASADHHMESEVFSDPEVFDPLRSWKIRRSAPDRRDQHRAGMTSADNLAFGHGLQACPGRRFAVSQVKMLIARLLYDFEFKLRDGEKRRTVQYYNETAWSDESTVILMRKRKV